MATVPVTEPGTGSGTGSGISVQCPLHRDFQGQEKTPWRIDKFGLETTI